MASANSGVSSLTADGCAGCHRAHTAEGPLLLTAASDEALCLTCHGAGTGATTDVLTGVQYRIAADGTRSGTVLGALRGGGFDQARIGDPFRYAVAGSTPGSVSRLSKVQVASSGADVTSAHLEMAANGLVQPGKAWGNGQNGTGPGPAVSIGCGSCHNPHGNGAYRILNTLPGATGTTTLWAASIVDYGVVAANTYRTAASHGFLIGDKITTSGNYTAGVNVVLGVVATVPSNNTFTLTGVTVAGTGIGGIAERIGGVKVIDAAAPPAGDERNYTVIQTPTAAGYTLLASQAAAYSSTAGDYFHYKVPWNAVTGSNLDAPNGIPGATLGATGFGQQITVWCAQCHIRYWAASEPTTSPANGTVGPAYSTARPGDAIFTFQHRTRGESGRSCVTCHVSHGTNAVMDGTYSASVPFPDGTVDVGNSRLLKVGNRGTCQLCHDPTGTIVVGDQYPPAPYPVPGTP